MLPPLARIAWLGLAVGLTGPVAVVTTAFSTPQALDALRDASSVISRDARAGELSPDEQNFVRSAHARGLFAIGAGQVAFEASSIDEVRLLAAHTLSQQAGIDERLAALAKTKRMASLPDQLDPGSRETLETLQQASGDGDFDLRYCGMVVASYLRDIRTFQRQADTASDPDLRKLASEIAAELKPHLAIALAIQRALASALDDSAASITV